VRAIRSKYVGVGLPESLIKEIDELVGTHGFQSRAEIVKEAVRNLLERYKNSPSQKDL